jgi:hypothetical protein
MSGWRYRAGALSDVGLLFSLHFLICLGPSAEAALRWLLFTYGLSRIPENSIDSALSE